MAIRVSKVAPGVPMPDDRPLRSPPGPLHLVPLGNLASIVVPVIVIGANVVWQALVVPVPERPPPDPYRAPSAMQSLGLSVLVEPAGYVITTGTGTTRIVSCAGCANPHDPAALQQALRALKRDHPDEVTVVVVPNRTTSYEVLMQTVKASREDAEGMLFPQAIIAGLGE